MWTYAMTAILAALVAFTGAWRVQEWRYRARDAERMEAAKEVERLRVKTADTAAEKHEQVKDSIRTEFLTIREEVERVVEKPVYRNVCIDDDGMRELQRAISGPKPPASEPSHTLP